MFPCEQPPRDSYVPAAPPTSPERLRRLGQDLWKLTPFAQAMLLLGDRKTPILAREPVWRSRRMRWLVRRVEKYLAPDWKSQVNSPPGKVEPGPQEKPPKENGTAATKCHMCGQHKESARSRRRITIGLKSGTVRWQFCDECAATLKKQSEPKDEDNNGQRL